MVYQTIEAYLQKDTITLPRFFPQSEKKVRVLITFVDDTEASYSLYELWKTEVTGELKELSKKALRKDKKLFSNI